MVTAQQGARDDRAMNRLLTYATDLDPQFAGAYRFAGNAMPRQTLDGKVTNVLQAEALLAKGVRERGDDWHISFALGFLQRSEEHTSELQSRVELVCRLL